MNHKNVILYILTILIWGSTWYPIKLSLGVVSPEVSVIYRLAIASVLLFGWCWLRRLHFGFSLKQHLLIALFGILLYGIDLTLLYEGSAYLNSGLVAIVFSTIVIMNIVNGFIIFGNKPDIRMVFGAATGIVGLGIAFWPELSALDIIASSTLGLLIVLGAALAGSFGNMISIHNQKDGIPVTQANALAMGYGAVFLSIYALVKGSEFIFDPSLVYVSSLLFLSVFGSIFAFGFYLTLLGSIGPAKTAYANLVYPIIALGIASAMESYEWNTRTLIAVALILFGNYLMMIKSRTSSGVLTAAQKK